MEQIRTLLDIIQQKVDSILDYACFFAIVIIGFLLISSMFRFLFGKRAQIGKSITSAMEIMSLYLICLIVYSFGLHYDLFLNPLPFISMEGGCMQVYPIIGAPFSEICTQIAKLLLIAFLVNLLNSIIPEGKKLWVWLMLRIITIILAVGVNYALDVALGLWLPEGIASYATMILLGVLVLLLLLGSLKLIIGLALGATNPVIGALYTFFFSNFIGRALARSILTTGLITALVYLLNSMHIMTLVITASSFVLLIPALLIVVLLWYIIDRIV